MIALPLALGHSHEEIGAVLGLSASTLGRRLRELREEIRASTS